MPIASGVSLDRDVPVRMRDGTRLMANVYRPVASGPAPVLMSVTPYSKDKTPDRIGMLLMRLSGVRFGKLECSRWTGFESPDPLFWAPNCAPWGCHLIPSSRTGAESRDRTQTGDFVTAHVPCCRQQFGKRLTHSRSKWLVGATTVRDLQAVGGSLGG